MPMQTFPCKVKNCKTRCQEGLSFFRAPKDVDKRNQWSSILGVNVMPSNRVCEKHFEKSQIKRNIVKKDADGRIIMEVMCTQILPSLNIFTLKFVIYSTSITERRCTRVLSLCLQMVIPTMKMLILVLALHQLINQLTKRLLVHSKM